MKIYIEIENGMITGAYTDDKQADINIVLCDHDDAEQETEDDDFEFVATNNCNELEDNRDNLRDLFKQ